VAEYENSQLPLVPYFATSLSNCCWLVSKCVVPWRSVK
jgi:hypothetical protein